jgi:hypothetical protein
MEPDDREAKTLNWINSFRSNCPVPQPAKLASMERKFARLSVSSTPPAPASPADFRDSLAAPAPWPEAEPPGGIDSDSVREENQTGSNPIKVNPSQSDRIKPQKIKKSAHSPRLIPMKGSVPGFCICLTPPNFRVREWYCVFWTTPASVADSPTLRFAVSLDLRRRAAPSSLDLLVPQSSSPPPGILFLFCWVWTRSRASQQGV